MKCTQLPLLPNNRARYSSITHVGLTHLSTQLPEETGSIILANFHMRKLLRGEVKHASQGHIAEVILIGYV